MKNSLSKNSFYVFSTNPCLVWFHNTTIPWKHKIRTIREPPVLVCFSYPLQPLYNLCLDPKSCMAVWLSSICLPRKLFNDRSLLSNMMLLCHWVLASTAPCKVHRLFTSYFSPSHFLAWADLHNWANLCMKSYLNSDKGTIHILRKHIFRLFGPNHPQPYVSIFYVLKISKNCHFLTPIRPTSAYVIYEWSQSENCLNCFF